MLLHPRKFKYKNTHKNRVVRNYRATNLVYGQYGLKVLQPLRISAKRFFKIKLFLKKAIRRSEKTSRYAWFHIFPHVPLTKKAEGSRMGKGKGKLVGWAIQVTPGIIILELKNLRSGRAEYFCKQISYKLPIYSRFVRKLTSRVPLILDNSRRVLHNTFW